MRRCWTPCVRLILQRYSSFRQLHKLSSVELLRRRITMTPEQVAALGPAFAAYLRDFADCFLQDRTREHLQTYCRGLLSDLPRKSIEPIALAAGTAVRTLQEFLRDHVWDHARLRDQLQQRVAQQTPPATA